MHQFEIIRLCALWDKSGEAEESIPSIADLIDSDVVIKALAEEHQKHWHDQHLSDYGSEQAKQATQELKTSIFEVRRVFSSNKLKSIKNVRNKHLAHSLSHTTAEISGLIAPMLYGDELHILISSCKIVEQFFCWINGLSWDSEQSRKIHKKNAEALWHHCTFDIQK